MHEEPRENIVAVWPEDENRLSHLSFGMFHGRRTPYRSPAGCDRFKISHRIENPLFFVKYVK